MLLGRTDALGAITGALLIYVLLRGRTATLYAGVFLMVGFLEIYGTSIGAWHWAATAPDTPLPSGNPPSGIASIYVLFDVSAIALAPRVLAAFDGLRRFPPLADSRAPPSEHHLGASGSTNSPTFMSPPSRRSYISRTISTFLGVVGTQYLVAAWLLAQQRRRGRTVFLRYRSSSTALPAAWRSADSLVAT